MEELATSRNSYCNAIKDQGKEVLGLVLENMDRLTVRVVRRSIDWKTSRWLTALPLASQHVDLSPVEFRDALSLRYKRLLVRMTLTCDGCGEISSVQRALDDWKGGLVIRYYDEIHK